MEYSNISFTNPVVTETEFVDNVNFKNESESIEMETKISRNFQYDKENKSIVNVEMTVEIGEKTNKVPFYIKVKMSANFKWESDEVGENQRSSFEKVNAPALLIGYIRPVVSYLTSLSKYPAYHIPFINFTDENMENKS